jgi:hypothetical protein
MTLNPITKKNQQNIFMKNTENIKKFIELRSTGHSFREISRILNKSISTIIKWNKQYCSLVFEVQSEEIKQFKSKLLEEKKSRLEYLNSYLLKLKNKLDKSEMLMRYDKLLLLFIKLSKSIDDCQRNIVLSEISNSLPDEENIDISDEKTDEENIENFVQNEETVQK